MLNMTIELKNLYDAYQSNISGESTQAKKQILCEYCNHVFILPPFASWAVCPFCATKLNAIRRGEQNEYFLYEAKIRLMVYRYSITVEV